MKNMTAAVSAFARAYHYRTRKTHIFADDLAEKILTEEEYERIAENMTSGIAWFSPQFSGTKEEALRFIMDYRLSPSVLARSAFAEQELDCSDSRQIVLFACGYDTFSLRSKKKDFTVYELDRSEMIKDRGQRIERMGIHPVCLRKAIPCDLSEESWKDAVLQEGFRSDETSFGTLLGISYYLREEEFAALLRTISSLFCEGSEIAFDYPMREEDVSGKQRRKLAAAAGEEMKSAYTRKEIERLLKKAGFAVRRHLCPIDAEEQFFLRYNEQNPGFEMHASEGTGYCLAEKRTE